ncbi:hypothetical protein D0O09_23980 [Pseudomonas putida]|nr:hypothetical protein D0O09_23980 [Pseudomonas putida]
MRASPAAESRWLKEHTTPVGAALAAKQATRWMARASPVFVGKPAPTVFAPNQRKEIPACCST